MRLSDAGMRCRKTEPIYPDHRFPPWLTEDATGDRSNRWLGAVWTLDSASRGYGIKFKILHFGLALNLRERT
jgi:hypothetical protein